MTIISPQDGIGHRDIHKISGMVGSPTQQHAMVFPLGVSATVEMIE
jgi:hypothetical protein